eukprot:7684158-Alexandrium_andersonii.AAC.1
MLKYTSHRQGRRLLVCQHVLWGTVTNRPACRGMLPASLPWGPSKRAPAKPRTCIRKPATQSTEVRFQARATNRSPASR